MIFKLILIDVAKLRHIDRNLTLYALPVAAFSHSQTDRLNPTRIFAPYPDGTTPVILDYCCRFVGGGSAFGPALFLARRDCEPWQSRP